MSNSGKRRWLKPTLVALGAAILILLAWLDSRSKWIYERQQNRVWIVNHAGSIQDEASRPPAPAAAPWSLRVCGESGIGLITIDERKLIRKTPKDSNRDPKSIARKLQRIFPESTILIRDVDLRESRYSEN